MHAWKRRAIAKRIKRQLPILYRLPNDMMFPKASDFIKPNFENSINIPESEINEIKERLHVSFTNHLMSGSLEVQL